MPEGWEKSLRKQMMRLQKAQPHDVTSPFLLFTSGVQQ